MYFLSKIINSCIKRGEKQRIENVILNCIRKLRRKRKSGISFLIKNLERKSKSLIELRETSSKRNKKKYPFFIDFFRNKNVTAKNLVKFSNKHYTNTFSSKIYNEFAEVVQNRGFTIDNKHFLQDFAIDNQPFISKYGKSSKKRKSLNKY